MYTTLYRVIIVACFCVIFFAQYHISAKLDTVSDQYRTISNRLDNPNEKIYGKIEPAPEVHGEAIKGKIQ